MKKNEKEILYSLLKTSDHYINGYEREVFNSTPEFTDDVETAEHKEEIETPQVKTPSPLSLSDLNTKILRCTHCALARTRNNVVIGQGVEHPDVLVIGDAPSYDDDMQGIPFTGKAGVLLDKMLGAIQLNRSSNCYITTTVKCKPQENREPYGGEIASCSSFLETQIHILKPKIILCLGRIPGNQLLKIDLPINLMHGQFYDYNGIPVMVTYHPNALLRNEELKRPAWHDLQVFKKQLDELNKK